MQIQINNLTKRFRGVDVLENINLTFNSGKIYGIVGKNGSGKTMLLRAISGLIVPTSGAVLYNGKELHKDISLPPDIGILIEKPEFLGYMSGFANLKMLASIKKTITDQQIEAWMTRFGLDPKSKKMIRKYSQGMRQKLGIIQAVMENQQIIILDESFNALDAQSVDILRDVLLECREEGKLVIITSHHAEDIEVLCDTVIKIADGHVIN